MSKNITLSADETLIRAARERAVREHTSLNQAFRQWLARYGQVRHSASRFDSLMEDLAHVEAGRRFNRDEMNER